MDRYTALALLEFDSIPLGTEVADAMVKAAPIGLIRAGTVQPGKHLVLVAGDVGPVEEAHVAGMRVGCAGVVDQVFLPDVHAEVYDAIFGGRRSDRYDALAIIETATIAAVIRAADAAVKGASVHVLEMRLGDALGGKGLVHLTGLVADAQVAVEIGTGVIADRNVVVRSTVIPIVHGDVARGVAATTRFFGTTPESV